MATIDKRGNTYRIRVAFKLPNGKWKQVAETYTPKKKSPDAIEKEVSKEAYRFEQSILEDLKHGNAPGVESTFSDLVDRYMKNNVSLSDRTRNDYRKLLAHHVLPVIGTKKLSIITAADIEHIFTKMPTQSIGTLKKVLAVISSVFTYGIRKEKLYMINPCQFVDVPDRFEEKKTRKAFTLHEIRVFENALSESQTRKVSQRTRSTSRGDLYAVSAYTYSYQLPLQYRTLFLLALKGGLRRGEICALQWGDVDLKTGRVHIQRAVTKVDGENVIKGTKSEHGDRVITFPNSVLGMLKEWRKIAFDYYNAYRNEWNAYLDRSFPESPVFIEESNGNTLDVDIVSKRFRLFLKAYNENCPSDQKLPALNFHGLRHTCASYLIKYSRMSIADIAAFMGHTPDVLLKIYSWAFDNEGQEGALAWENFDSQKPLHAVAR